MSLRWLEMTIRCPSDSSFPCRAQMPASQRRSRSSRLARGAMFAAEQAPHYGLTCQRTKLQPRSRSASRTTPGLLDSSGHAFVDSRYLDILAASHLVYGRLFHAVT